MKNLLQTLTIMMGILGCNAQTQGEREEEIRSEINADFDQNRSECYAEIDAVTDFNGKTEFWDICELENGNRIIKIESYKGDTFYQEIYFEKNGDLIYAKETEHYMPKNHFMQIAWNCEFYAKNGELIALMSLGHGKTENDEWDAEEIFEMYKNRMAELKKVKK